MLPHVMRQGTHDGPNKALQARAAEMEATGDALAATLFTGFPHADIREAGLSAVVITDGDAAKARRLCDELLDAAWRDHEAFADGLFRNLGPAAKGVLMDMGPTVVLDTGRVEIVIASRQQEPNDKNCLLSLGIDPARKRFLMLKSRVHWRAGFGDIAKDVIECAGTGVCTSDYNQLTFRKVRRPMYPLDRLNDTDAI